PLERHVVRAALESLLVRLLNDGEPDVLDVGLHADRREHLPVVDLVYFALRAPDGQKQQARFVGETDDRAALAQPLVDRVFPVPYCLVIVVWSEHVLVLALYTVSPRRVGAVGARLVRA